MRAGPDYQSLESVHLAMLKTLSSRDGSWSFAILLYFCEPKMCLKISFGSVTHHVGD